MKTLYKIIGTLSLVLGLVGIFLPILPTTPFLLLTATLYAKSSERLYSWLMNHPRLGAYIEDFRRHRTLPLRVKVISVTVLWATILLSVFLVKILFVRVFLLFVAVAVTVHILHYKTRK
ncbi:MAG: YbaN family protein [Paludibacteraceae bacterium]|nr:YbaN family protein [Paludibacteraceae bacterium]